MVYFNSIRRKQHWKSKSSSGYAINVGRVSVWKLHWFGGTYRLFICLLGISIILNDLLDYIYRRINMIMNVARMKMYPNYISVRPQMVGDIDMVWLLRGYGEDYGRLLFNEFVDIYLSSYIFRKKYSTYNYPLLLLTNASTLHISIKYIPSTKYIIPVFYLHSFSYLNNFLKEVVSSKISSIYNYIYNNYRLKNMYTGSLLNCINIIHRHISNLYNSGDFFVKHIYRSFLRNKLLKYHINTYNAYTVGAGLKKNAGFKKRIYVVDTKFLLYNYSYYMFSNIYYYIYMSSNMCMYKMDGFFSFFFKKHCMLDNMNYIDFRYRPLFSHNNKNTIMYTGLNKFKYYYNNYQKKKHIIFVYLAFGDMYITKIYKHIDFLLYHFAKNIYYRGVNFFNLLPKISLKNINYLRILYIILYLYRTRFNSSIITLYRGGLVSSKHKYRYYSNYLYKLGLFESISPITPGANYTVAKNKMIWNKKIRKNAFEYYQILLWNTYLEMIFHMFSGVRRIYRFFSIMYLYIKYAYDREMPKFFSENVNNIKLFWYKYIITHIKSNQGVFMLYTLCPYMFSTFNHFRNYCFLKFYYYGEILNILYYLRLVVKRMRTLSNRWPKPEPNTFSKVLVSFMSMNIHRDVESIYDNNISYYYHKLNLFKFFHSFLSTTMFYSKIKDYRIFYKNMSPITYNSPSNYCFNMEYIIEKPFNTFFYYQLYSKLFQWYGLKSNIVMYLIIIVIKIRFFLYRCRVLFKYLCVAAFDHMHIINMLVSLIKKIRGYSFVLMQCKDLVLFYLLFDKRALNVNYIKDLSYNFGRVRNLHKSLGFYAYKLSLAYKYRYLYTNISYILNTYYYILYFISSGSCGVGILYGHFNSINSVRDIYSKIYYWCFILNGLKALNWRQYNYISKDLFKNINYFARIQILGYGSGINLLTRKLLYFNNKYISIVKPDDVEKFNVLYIYRDKRSILYSHIYTNYNTGGNMFAGLYYNYLNRWVKSFLNSMNFSFAFNKINVSNSNSLCLGIIYNIVHIYKYLSYIYNFMHSLKLFAFCFSGFFFHGKSHASSSLYLSMNFLFSDIYVTNIIRTYYALVFLNVLLRNKIKHSILRRSIVQVLEREVIFYSFFKEHLNKKDKEKIFLFFKHLYRRKNIYFFSEFKSRSWKDKSKFPTNYAYNIYAIRAGSIFSSRIKGVRRVKINKQWKVIDKNALRLCLLSARLFHGIFEKERMIFYINQILKFDYFLVSLMCRNLVRRCFFWPVIRYKMHRSAIMKLIIRYISNITNIYDSMVCYNYKRSIYNYINIKTKKIIGIKHSLFQKRYSDIYTPELIDYVVKRRILKYDVRTRSTVNFFRQTAVAKINKYKAKMGKGYSSFFLKKKKNRRPSRILYLFSSWCFYLNSFVKCVYLYKVLYKYTFMVRIFWLYSKYLTLKYNYFNMSLFFKKTYIFINNIVPTNFISLSDEGIAYYKYLYSRVRLILGYKCDKLMYSFPSLYNESLYFSLMRQSIRCLYSNSEYVNSYGILTIYFFMMSLFFKKHSSQSHTSNLSSVNLNNFLGVYGTPDVSGIFMCADNAYMSLINIYINLLYMYMYIYNYSVKYIYILNLLHFHKCIIHNNIFRYIILQNKDNVGRIYRNFLDIYAYIKTDYILCIFSLIFYKFLNYKNLSLTNLGIVSYKHIYNTIFYINYFYRRYFFFKKSYLDIEYKRLYSNSLLKSRLYKIYKTYYRKGDRSLYYNTFTYKRKLHYLYNYIYSISLIGSTRLYKDHNVKLLSRYRFWRYYLHIHLVEFRRSRLLGKYKYNYVPKRISYSWYVQSLLNKHIMKEEMENHFWYSLMVFERAYKNTLQEFYGVFRLFDRSTQALFWEDVVYMFLLNALHLYISRYLLVLFNQTYGFQSMNYYPQIYTNEDYLDPPIIDPDFICKYIKVAISKQDTLYEAISEMRVWIIRSIHRFKTFSYFYRKGYRRKLVNYKINYKVPLVRSVKIEVSGRVHDRRRTIVRVYKLGWKTTTSRVKDRPLQYSSLQGQSKYGVFGIKVWILLHYQLVRGLVK